MESRSVFRRCLSFTPDKSRANSRAVYPDTLRAYMYSTRGHVLDAQRKRIVRSNPCRYDRIHGCSKKIGAGIGARNHGINLLKSRRRVCNLRRSRPRTIALPVTAASRNNRLQALPQLTPPERLGQAIFDTETLDFVLPKDESRLNDDGRRDAGRAQLV